jgi:hypothetical protein
VQKTVQKTGSEENMAAGNGHENEDQLKSVRLVRTNIRRKKYLSLTSQPLFLLFERRCFFLPKTDSPQEDKEKRGDVL